MTNAWEVFQEYINLGCEANRITKCITKSKDVETINLLFKLQDRICKDMLTRKQQLDKLRAWSLIFEYKSLQANQLVIMGKLCKIRGFDKVRNICFKQLNSITISLAEIKNKLKAMKISF